MLQQKSAPFKDHCQSFEDQHRATTTDFTGNTTFPDLIPQDSTTNDHHYFQDHHTNTRTSSQDHIHNINRNKNTSSQDHINSHKDTVHSKYTTYIFPYHTHHNIVLHEDRRQQVIKTFCINIHFIYGQCIRTI